MELSVDIGTLPDQESDRFWPVLRDCIEDWRHSLQRDGGGASKEKSRIRAGKRNHTAPNLKKKKRNRGTNLRTYAIVELIDVHTNFQKRLHCIDVFKACRPMKRGILRKVCE